MERLEQMGSIFWNCEKGRELEESKVILLRLQRQDNIMAESDMDTNAYVFHNTDWLSQSHIPVFRRNKRMG